MAQPPKSKYSIEPIPDSDLVSRCCFTAEGSPSLDPASDFTNDFELSATDPSPKLSVVWRKYAVECHDVDQRGEIIADKKNARNQAKGKHLRRLIYTGYRTATVQTIRTIRSERNFRFSVTHIPDDTFRAHALIALEHADHPGGPALTRNDRIEMRHQLVNQMPRDDDPPNDECI